MMRFLELFTGIAGFSKGIERVYGERDRLHRRNRNASQGNGRSGAFEPSTQATESSIRGKRSSTDAIRSGDAGSLQCIGFSEISKTPSAILRYLYPDVRNYGDASLIVCDELPDFDFLCGGFPCQDFSIAGKRQGIDGARGTLFFEIARILSHKRPRHFLLENVKGLLSSDDGQTYPRILRVLADLDYRVETVVLNSKHYGVPQNRERVFFIGHLGSECAGEILSFGESGQWANDSPTKPQEQGERLWDYPANALSQRDYKGGNQVIEVGTLRTHKDGEGFRQMSENISPTLNGRARQDDSQQTVIAMAQGVNRPSRGIEIRKDGIAATLKSGQSGTQRPTVAIPVLTPDRATTRQHGRRMKEDGEASFTVTAQDQHGVMIADKRIRRLTPVECMRLQDFPDDHADFGINEKGERYAISDTGKYQVAGNAVTCSVIEAIITEMLNKGCLQ